jgi:plasmid stabilization system protein ParE
LVFSSVFEADFAELLGYFHEVAGSHVSNKFETSAVAMVERLQQNPEMGRIRRALKPEGIRTFGVPRFRNYLVFYRIDGRDLVFLRLRFGGMDLPSLFNR